MAISGPKQCINPFGRMSFFRLLKLLVFIAQKGVFSVLEYHKRHFPALHCLKKKSEKWSFLDQNHELIPLQKCQIFDCLNFLFLQPRKSFFRCRISEKTFSQPILHKNKLEKWPFLDQNNALSPLERSHFFDF